MAEAWAENNEWFGKDSAMTYTAFDLHENLPKKKELTLDLKNIMMK